MYSFPDLELVCCPMSSSNCCFLTCIQISQESGQMVWHSHLLKNFPQFVVNHTVKAFGIVSKAEVDVFLELSCFFDDSVCVGNLTYGSSAFSKSSLNFWKFMVHVLLKPGLKNFEHYFASMWDECIQLWMSLVMEVKSSASAVKNNIALELGMLGPWIKANWKWSNRRWHEWTSAF